MKSEHVEFEIIREDFNIYRVDNGQILKVRKILSDIVNKIEDGKSKGGLAFKDVSNVITPEGIDVSNLVYSDLDKVTEKDQVREMEFSILKESISIYETEKSIILIVPSMLKIFLTNKKDQANAPILRFNMAANISIIDKSSLTMPSTEENDSDLSKGIKLG